MATTTRDIRRVTVELSQAELASLLVTPATNAGYIDFVPTGYTFEETDQVAGTWAVTFVNDEEIV